jgi:hypothetical protein
MVEDDNSGKRISGRLAITPAPGSSSACPPRGRRFVSRSRDERPAAGLDRRNADAGGLWGRHRGVERALARAQRTRGEYLVGPAVETPFIEDRLTAAGAWVRALIPRLSALVNRGARRSPRIRQTGRHGGGGAADDVGRA